jgi:Ethanolamine utilization protein EutJ (predicted chaperonin)
MANISKKNKKQMSNIREIAGTAYAVKQMYDMVKPVVEKGIDMGKTYIDNRKKKRVYKNNTYNEGMDK